MKNFRGRFDKFICKHQYLVAALLILVMFFLSFFSILNDSITSDESIHIIAGFSYVDKFDNRLNLEHPPLIKIISAIPLIFLDLEYEFDDILNFVYKPGSNPDQILLLARLPIIFIALLLGIYVFKWAKLCYGIKPALLALFLFAFSPNIIAHARLVTTDIGAITSFFIFLYYFTQYIKSPSYFKLIISGLIFGIAQLTKFSNIILYLLVLIILIALIVQKKYSNKYLFIFLNKIKNVNIRNTLFYFLSACFIFISGNILIWLIYFIFSINMPGGVPEEIISKLNIENSNIFFIKPVLNHLFQYSLLKPYALYLLGLSMTFIRISDGAVVYFFGKLIHGSFWYFYPLSFLIKTPIAALLMFFVSISMLISKGCKNFISKVKNNYSADKLFFKDNFSEFIFWSAIIVSLATGITSNLNIGLRHILIIYPFIFIIIAKYIYILYKKRSLAVKACVVILFLWIILENILIFPHYLAYFNQFVGGHKNAYRYSVDSNLDWGQDLKRLAAWVKDNKINEIKVEYGRSKSFHPEYYLGDRYKEWHFDQGKTDGWIAISASEFQTNSFWSPGQSDWLTNNYQPYYILGGSILIYHIEQ